MAGLKIKITDLRDSPTGTSGTVKINQKIASPDKENLKILEPVAGEIRFTKLAQGIVGDFDLKTRIELICDRCLEKISQKQILRFKQEFISEKAPKTQENADKIASVSPRGWVEVMPAIEQEILLAIPSKVLCNKNCKIKNLK